MTNRYGITASLVPLAPLPWFIVTPNASMTFSNDSSESSIPITNVYFLSPEYSTPAILYIMALTAFTPDTARIASTSFCESFIVFAGLNAPRDPGVTNILFVPKTSNCPLIPACSPCPNDMSDTTAAIPMNIPMSVSNVLFFSLVNVLNANLK